MTLAVIDDLMLSGGLSWVAAIPVAIWIFTFISWSIMGDIEPIVGVLGTGAAFALLYALHAAPTPLFAVLGTVVLYGTVIAIPISRRHLSKRRFAEMDVEQIESAYRMLSVKPDNPAAKYRMAEGLYARGCLWQAVAIAEDALEQLPELGFEAERRAVGGWRRAAEARNQVSSLPCLQCGHVNQPESVYCGRCRSSYLVEHARGRWLSRSLGRKLLAAWVVGLVVFVGVPYVASEPQITSGGQIVIIIAEVALCAFVLVRAFRKGADA